jgi:YihY family inner membrane protein
MDVVTRIIRGIDRGQQRQPWTAYPVAVFKKFGDDQGGKLAALIAYYAFLAIFPLFLVFATILGYLLKGNPELQVKILNSAISEFPAIGDQIRKDGLSGHWYVLVISGLISLWGARGVADATQYAFNTIWNVPYAHRPDWLTGLLRSFGLLFTMALAVVVTGLLSGIGEFTSSFGIAIRILAFATSTVINVAIFMLAFRVATARHVKFREMFWAAVASAVLWQVLLVVGALLVARQVRHQEVLYGTISTVLGLLFWLHLQAQVTIFALEATVVRVRKMWPRSVSPPPLTTGDRRAFRAYAEATRRVPAGVQEVAVTFAEPREPRLLDRILNRRVAPAHDDVDQPEKARSETPS